MRSFFNTCSRCRVLEDDELSADEHQHIRECITQIQPGNYSDFDEPLPEEFWLDSKDK